ncbi:MAG: TonB-dependent receptor [Rikenellaceae bacterium]
MRYIVLFILTIFCGELFAHSRDSVAYNLDMDGIMISSGRSITELIPVQVLGYEEIERLGAHSVADALRYFSGLQIKDYGGVGGLKTVNIRSLGSQHVGVFYDGVAIGNAQNGTVDLGRFSLDNMESISLYNGQKSAIFQPAKDYSSASSIYLQSRRPKFEGDKSYNAKVTLKGGSFDLINPSVLYEHRLSERLSASLSAEYLYTSGEYKFTYQKTDGYSVTDTRRNGDVRALRGEATLFGAIKSGEWRSKIYYYDSERGYPGASVRGDGTYQNEDRQWDNNLFVQGALRKSLSSKYSMLINAKYAHDRLRYLADDPTTKYTDNTFTQQEGYVSVANLIILNHWWSANASIDYTFNHLESNMDGMNYPHRSTLLGAVATSAKLGKFNAQASLLYTLVADVADSSTSKSDEWTPTAIVTYTPLKDHDLQIRAFYKRIFRSPTLNDLYYTDVGNADLRPEYTTQYNIGAEYKKGFNSTILRAIEISADGYYNRVHDKIIAMPTSNQFRWTMINLGEVEILGIDFATQGALKFGAVDLNMRLNYTYQDSRNITDPMSDYYGDQIPYTPLHSGSAVVGSQYRGWELNYSFIYTGERYEAEANIPENYVLPWYTHDLALAKSFDIKSTTLRATAEVNNLMNQQYEVVHGYPMPGTNFKIILSVNF